MLSPWPERRGRNEKVKGFVDGDNVFFAEMNTIQTRQSELRMFLPVSISSIMDSIPFAVRLEPRHSAAVVSNLGAPASTNNFFFFFFYFHSVAQGRHTKITAARHRPPDLPPRQKRNVLTKRNTQHTVWRYPCRPQITSVGSSSRGFYFLYVSLRSHCAIISQALNSKR